MNDTEKLFMAKMALKLISKEKPKQNYYESGYNIGGYKDCPQCRKMVDLAKSALEELENEPEVSKLNEVTK